jgi:serine/threonine protein kinase
MKYLINYKLSKDFKSFTINIKSYFNASQTSIHKARNEIKVVDFNDKSLIIKAFKIPNIINKIAYSFFRDSKAKKSYLNSLNIKQYVPEPISYIEFFKYGLLYDSYFISEHFNYDLTIREPLIDTNYSNKETIYKQFAKFTFDLHENNILHLDYSPGNILIKKEDDKYIFKIVDINRMQFKDLNLNERLKNFSKLWAKDEDLIIIIKEYSKLINKDEQTCINIALNYSQKHKNKINNKKRRRGQLVVD